MTPWPIRPPPRKDESLISWFARLGRQYGMRPDELLAAVEHEPVRRHARSVEATLQRLRCYGVTGAVADLARLQLPPRVRLWRQDARWELRDHPLGIVCPQCWVEDIDQEREPYGRQCWHQAWYTVCHVHCQPLARSSLAQKIMLSPTPISPPQLVGVRAAMCRLRHSHAGGFARQVIDALLEIQRTIKGLSWNVVPDPTIWGPLRPAEFPQVFADITTWSLTHFEPVRDWCAAEDLTEIERHSGPLLGRHLRGSSTSYPDGRTTRDLNQIIDPAVRRSALWLAHALMASHHTDAADRVGGRRPQVRQRNRLTSVSPNGLQWLADRSKGWPEGYRLARWIDLRATARLSG